MPPPTHGAAATRGTAPICPSTFSDDAPPSGTRDTGAVAPDRSTGEEAASRLRRMAPSGGGRTSVLGPLPRPRGDGTAPFYLTIDRRGHHEVAAYRVDSRFDCVPNGSAVTVNGRRYRLFVVSEGEHAGRYIVPAEPRDSATVRYFRSHSSLIRAIPGEE